MMQRVLLILLFLAVASVCDAAPIQNLTMEGYTAGNNLPDPDPFCASSCGYASPSTGTAQLTANCVPGNAGSLLGTKCARWGPFSANLAEAGVQIQCSGTCNVAVSAGETIYLGFMWHFAVSGDLYHDGPGANSADKGIGIHSPGLSGGYRWDFSMGCWDSYTECTDHHHTVWVGNPSYHFNVGGCGENNDIYRPNVSPYTSGTVPQLAYNRWHAGVLAITLSSGSSGRVQAWVDGEKFLDCGSIKTMDTSDNDYAYIEHQGTFCQPAYDCPVHTRYWDNLIVSKDSADVAFLLTDPEADGGGSSTGGSMDVQHVPQRNELARTVSGR